MAAAVVDNTNLSHGVVALTLQTRGCGGTEHEMQVTHVPLLTHPQNRNSFIDGEIMLGSILL